MTIKFKIILCVNLVYVVCNGRNILGIRWSFIYIFWELALIPIYFIALIWGNGDTDQRKKAVVKFFIYTLGSLFMLVAFVYMYQKREAFIRRFIQIKLNSNRTIMDILGFLLSVCN
jgi:NADH-quinone oxidoreductase subunit M